MTPSLLKLGAVALAYTSGTLAYQKEYKLADEFKPSNFFNKFDFKTFNSGNDPNGGHVLYQSQSQANDLGLISTHADHVYIGVDSVGAEAAGRKSVRIESKDSYNYGLFVIEFSHLPKQVCGAWPAFWLNGPSWPTTGEVDIYEGWNLNPQNKIVGHTGNPSDVGVCKIDTDLISSTLSFKNCHISAEEQPNNAGCAVDEKNGLFGNPNGGVWATEWTEESFKVWSWAPNQKPANLVNGKPDPSTWGIPSFTLSTASCDVKRAFKDMKMILNINFCGDAAGNLFNEGCAQSTKTTCDQYVSWNPSAFKDVFWKVKGIDIYQLETVTVSSTSISSTSTSSSATSTEVSSTTEPSSTETSTEATSTETSTEASSTEATSTEATSTEATSTEATSTEASVTETETSATKTETATITTAPDVTSTTIADTSSTTATDDDNCSDDEEETSTAETVTATKTEATATETATETEATATETATETEGTETATKTEATATETASEIEATATETATEAEGTKTATKTEATATETASETGATATETATETSTEVEEFTTSTIYATTTLTFTSCAPSVTNCPGRVVTSVIAIGTTVCPVTHTPVPSLSLTATVTASPQPTGVVTPLPSGWTTSTVYSTKIITVSSCAPTVPNCPGRVTTTLVPIGTTICPVGSGSTTAPGGGSPGGPGVPEIDTTLTTLLTATSTATVVVPPPVTPSVFVPPVVIVPSIVPTGATGGIKPPQVNGTFTAKPPTQPEASKPVPVVEGPVPSGKSPVTVGGAAKMAGSGLMAAVAGAFMVFML